MSRQVPGYIAIEGPIGVGKTSLARRIADEFGSDLLLEEPQDNPFLERFYEDPRGAALPTQLFFLMQRVRQMGQFKQGDIFRPVQVADFLIEKDYLFAQATLDDDELGLYEQVYEQMTIEAPVPDLVIYLQAPVSTLMERIKRRGRHYERMMESAYLQRLNEAYTQFFYHYQDAPLLIVNAEEIDFVNNDADYRQLLDTISGIKTGRHYYNPLPFDLNKT
ncbi:MAG: deoxynucleoside kinase [Gammaproteobacteria bacterium]|nr:deoxynucleoside kinase [Gammaproteobacteria bacterium]